MDNDPGYQRCVRDVQQGPYRALAPWTYVPSTPSGVIEHFLSESSLMVVVMARCQLMRRRMKKSCKDYGNGNNGKSDHTFLENKRVAIE